MTAPITLLASDHMSFQLTYTRKQKCAHMAALWRANCRTAPQEQGKPNDTIYVSFENTDVRTDVRP